MKLAITSIGMISSVGYDYTNSCASIRAGLNRPQEIDYFDIVDSDLQKTVPLIGYPIRGYSEGFHLIGLWIRLAIKCLDELRTSGALPNNNDYDFWSNTALICAIPYIDDDRFLSDGNETPSDTVEPYILPLLKVADIPIREEDVIPTCMGHAAVIKAIQQAEEMIEAGKKQRVIILAVDSYLDTLTLEWLISTQRLKTNNETMGLMPGEGGGCFLVESLKASANRGAKNYAFVKNVALGKEKENFSLGKISNGIGLASVITSLFLNSSISVPFHGDIIADLNGENWRAIELAGALQKLGSKIEMSPRIVIPSLSTGDTGAASGAIAISVAVHSIQHNYSKGEDILILSSTERGDVAATVIGSSA